MMQRDGIRAAPAGKENILSGPVQFALLELLGLFKTVRSVLFPPCCRFVPSCTEYAEEAIRLHGITRAVPRILGRLLRCHPFHPGGLDPVTREVR